MTNCFNLTDSVMGPCIVRLLPVCKPSLICGSSWCTAGCGKLVVGGGASPAAAAAGSLGAAASRAAAAGQRTGTEAPEKADCRKVSLCTGACRTSTCQPTQLAVATHQYQTAACLSNLPYITRQHAVLIVIEEGRGRNLKVNVKVEDLQVAAARLPTSSDCTLCSIANSDS